MSDNIPENAMSVSFHYGKGIQGKYYVWETKGGKYQWSAFGNGGEADSLDKATSQAREWIINDYNPV